MPCSNPIPAVDYGYKLNKHGERVRNIKILDMKGKYISYGIEELRERLSSTLSGKSKPNIIA